MLAWFLTDFWDPRYLWWRNHQRYHSANHCAFSIPCIYHLYFITLLCLVPQVLYSSGPARIPMSTRSISWSVSYFSTAFISFIHLAVILRQWKYPESSEILAEMKMVYCSTWLPLWPSPHDLVQSEYCRNLGCEALQLTRSIEMLYPWFTDPHLAQSKIFIRSLPVRRREVEHT